MKLGKNKRDPDATAIRVAQGTYQKAMAKKLVTQLVLVFLAVLLVYLCFAATIVRVVPSSAGFIPLKNNTYPGGTLPLNSQALIDLDHSSLDDTSILSRLKQSFIPQSPSALVSVIAGPVGEVKWTGGTVTVDGNVLPATFPQDPDIEFLENQYIAVCIEGDCTPGAATIFVSEQVIGVPFDQNATVPPPAAFAAQGKVNRSDALEIVGAYLVEGYNGESKLACSLLAPDLIEKLGGISACEDDTKKLRQALGARYDFNSNLSLEVASETDANLVVKATLRVANSPLEASYTLKSTPKGFAITKLGTLKK